MPVIRGDWNVKAGNKAETNVRKFGLGVRNKAGDWLMDFCEAKNLSIASNKQTDDCVCGHHQMANTEIK